MNTLNENPTTPETALQMAARAGVILSESDLAEMARLMDARRAQVAAQDDGKPKGFVVRFNRAYPAFLEALIAFGDVMIATTRTVLIAFGVPVVLIMLLAVEQTRVFHGISLFERDSALAAFGALSLVILNLLLEFLTHWLERQAGYTEPDRFQFSLRIALQRALYVLGMGTAWQPRPKSPAARFRGLARVVTTAILALALGGSMRDAIAARGGAWSDAIRAILFESTLSEIATWAGGLLFAAAAVLSAQALSRYVAGRVVEIVATMQAGAGAQADAAADAVGAAYVLAHIKQAQRARRRGKVSQGPWDGLGHDGAGENGELSQGAWDNVGQPSGNGHGPAGVGAAVNRALGWLAETPDRAGMSIRDMASAAGVSRTTMSRALDLHRLQQPDA